MTNRLWKSALLACVAATACGDSNDNDQTDVDAAVSVDAGQGIDSAPAPDAAPAVGTCGVTGLPDGTNVYYATPDGVALGSDTGITTGMSSRNDCVDGTIIALGLPCGVRGGAPCAPDGIVFLGVNLGTTVSYNPPSDPGPAAPNSSAIVTGTDPDGTDSLGITEIRTGVAGGCTSTADADFRSPTSRLITAACLGDTPGDIDVIALAQDSSSTAYKVAVAKDVAVTMDGDTNVTLGAWTDPVQHSLAVTNMASELDAHISMLVDGAYVGNNGSWLTPDQNGEATLPSGPTAAGFVEEIKASAYEYLPSGYRSLAIRSTAPTGAAPAPTPFDWSMALPAIPAAALLTSDPTAVKIVWLADGDMPAETAGFASLYVDGGSLTLVFPPSFDGEIVIPALPAFPQLSQSNLFLIEVGFFGRDNQDYQALLQQGEGPEYDGAMMSHSTLWNVYGGE